VHVNIIAITAIALGTLFQPSSLLAEIEIKQIRSAVAGGLHIVQKAARNYPKHRRCFSCHHQTLPMLAMELSGRKGLDVDQRLLQDQAEFAWTAFDSRRETVAEGKGVGGGSMSVGYALWALDTAHWKKDETTTAMVSFLLKKQSKDGSWRRSTERPPLEDSNFTCTILAVYYMGKFANGEQAPEVEKATQQARKWILSSQPISQEDRVSRLGALALLKADQEEIKRARAEILAAQNDDGGWSQLPEMSSDAYATGLTLFTLHRTGLTTVDPPFQRGLQFLLDTQCDDGSWFVKSRSKPIQRFFDNGDPHGKDQFISIPGTSWATAALALALPSPNRDLAAPAPTDATKPQTYVYKKVGDLEIKADVYRYSNEHVRPAVVWIHGGALIIGHRAGIRYC
jgi:N-acyl-D-amino-acid deacylase